MGKKGGGRNLVLQSLHLSCVCNESMGGTERGGCVNLAVVPNESRSYFGVSPSLRSRFHVAVLDLLFDSLCLFNLNLQCSKMYGVVCGAG